MNKLPTSQTIRWTPKRKALVLDAIRAGQITEAEACAAYSISEEELGYWIANDFRGGIPALRVTRIQAYAATFAAQ